MTWKPLLEYNKTEKLQTLLQSADERKVNTLRSWKVTHPNRLLEWMRIRLTYSTNALEGSSLTMIDIVKLVETGLTVDGKPLRDYQDALGHDKALHFAVEMAEKKTPLTEDHIKNLHRLMFVQEENAGTYKTDANFTYTRQLVDNTPVIQTYVHPEHVQQQMEELLVWIEKHETKEHPACLSAVVHYNLARIHPFRDGNGRIARLLGNLMLLRNTFTPAVIKPEQKSQYIHALLCGHQKHDLTPFVEFIVSCLVATQNELIEQVKDVASQ